MERFENPSSRWDLERQRGSFRVSHDIFNGRCRSMTTLRSRVIIINATSLFVFTPDRTRLLLHELG